MWESPMPEKEDGWVGALTIPRELTLQNNHLYMKPIEELKNLRTHSIDTANITLKEPELITSKSSHIEVNIEHQFEHIQETITKFELKDAHNKILSLEYNANNHEFSLYRTDKDDYRYATIQSHQDLKLQIFIDKSSIEIFINDGEAVFTERYYTEDDIQVWISSTEDVPTSNLSIK